MDDRELTKKLRKLAELHSRAVSVESEIYTYSIQKYGVEPSEINNDEFIDSCTGGTSGGGGMTAKEFHDSMINAMDVAGLDTKGL